MDDSSQILRSLHQTVHAISALIECRDPYTVKHQSGVSVLVRHIGQFMGLPADQIECLRLAGTLHDIGKIAIPAEILTKPSRLTEEEFALVRTHAEVGRRILEPIDFPWPVADIVSQHHERLDGSGYPQGLPGGEILFEAKVLAVADTLESMATNRPYRDGLGIEAALQQLNDGKHRLYDGDVVDAVMDLVHHHREQFEQYGSESELQVVGLILDL